MGDDEACQNARTMSDDEWQRFVTREYAKAIGRWLADRGRLERPIHRLTIQDLEGAGCAAVSRFLVLESLRLKECEAPASDLAWIVGV